MKVPKVKTNKDWSDLTNQTPTKKKESKSQTHSLSYNEDATKFPHTGFPIRLEYVDGKDKRTCWFQCKEHFIKHVTRYKLKPNEYEATTNLLALVG